MTPSASDNHASRNGNGGSNQGGIPTSGDEDWITVVFENRQGGRYILEFNRTAKVWRIPGETPSDGS